MKKTLLLSLTASALLIGAVESKAYVYIGEAMWSHLMHEPPCQGILVPEMCPETNWFVTLWVDLPLTAATGLDALATYDQQEKVVDAKDALEQLEENLGGGCSGDQEDGTDSSLTGSDGVPLAPEVILESIDEADGFVKVRAAVKDYLFETPSCDHDCVLERQNTWLLTSIAMAASTGDKIVALSEDMSDEYQAMVDDFNGQTSPKGMWGGTSKITLHTHVQQNDINALYARDLEMNALNGARESSSTVFIAE